MFSIRTLLILFVAVVAVGLPLTFEIVDPGLSLVKNEWKCSQSVLKNNTTFVMSESVMVPINFQQLDCVQWTKKGYE